jgi:3-dehydroquinate synthase
MQAGSVLIQQEPGPLVHDFFLSRQYTQVFVLTDHHTQQWCYPLVQHALPAHRVISVKPGEDQKNLNTCIEIWQQLTLARADRKALLFILGGGVLGDMGGFCAATFKRGIDFVLMPTTLLAQVDASVGGKLGIDFDHFKNHIGVFQLPACTLVSPAFLTTLPERELRSGFAEVIKHCLISDAALWRSLSQKKWRQQEWLPLINHSVRFKERVVAEDPKEKGWRKILNFGHTVGHAVESYFLPEPQRLFHGEAIAIGMIVEAFISQKKGLLAVADLQHICTYLLQVFGKVEREMDIFRLIEAMRQDKKNSEGKILMALMNGLGQAVWDVEVSEDEITEGISFYTSHQT